MLGSINDTLTEQHLHRAVTGQQSNAVDGLSMQLLLDDMEVPWTLAMTVVLALIQLERVSKRGESISGHAVYDICSK
jgi:hypothetical protein